MEIVKAKMANAMTSAASDHVIAVTADVYDEDIGKYQNQINSDVETRISELEESGSAAGMTISGTFNVSTAAASQYRAIFSSMSVGDMRMYLVTDSSGNLPSSETAVTVTYDGVLSPAFLYFGKSDNFGVSVGDILVFAKLNALTNVCRIIPLNDVKAANGDFPGADGLSTVWDKSRINKIDGIEWTVNNALPKSSQLPSRWNDNMNNALQTGVYPWCTLGRPAGSTGAYTCIVRRTSTDDGAYNTIEQTAYGREGELGKVYKRIIFEKNDGTDTQYGEWLEVTNSGSNIPEVVVEKREDDTLGYNDLSDVNENDYIVKIIFSTEGSTDTEVCIGIRTNHYVIEVLSYYTISWWSSGTIHYTYIKYTEESPDTSVAGREFFIKREYVRTDSKITASQLDSDVTAMIDERIANAITTTLNTEV
jgi:hypothetical protein